MRDSGVLNLEQHCSELLDHAREAGGLRSRRQAKFASRGNDDVVGSAHERGSSRQTRNEGVSRNNLGVHLERGGLKSGMDDPRVTAQLRDDPLVLRAGSDCRRHREKDRRKEDRR
jgi:hypothetical protein